MREYATKATEATTATKRMNSHADLVIRSSDRVSLARRETGSPIIIIRSGSPFHRYCSPLETRLV